MKKVKVRKIMGTSEIIAGLKDLIEDRESFIEHDADHDDIFVHDKKILEAAIKKLTIIPRNKPQTLRAKTKRKEAKSMDYSFEAYKVEHLREAWLSGNYTNAELKEKYYGRYIVYCNTHHLKEEAAR